MTKTNGVVIPHGWRRLEPGEVVEDGDFIFARKGWSGHAPWRERYATRVMGIIIRKTGASREDMAKHIYRPSDGHNAGNQGQLPQKGTDE